MYFSRATLVSALAGFASAQSASGAESAASPTLSTAVAGPVSTGTQNAMPGMVNTHVVQVGGPNGSLAFYPSNVVAAPGDLVQFQFHPKNHSVVQSTFDNPCVPIQNIMPNKTDAFYSGFMPTNASFAATSQVLTYTIRVSDEKPVWFYCSQGQHCQAGMVGAINAPAEGNKTMAAFVALAAQATENLSPGQAGGSTGGNTPVSPSAGGGSNAGSDNSGTGNPTATTSSGLTESTGAASSLHSQSMAGAVAQPVTGDAGPDGLRSLWLPRWTDCVASLRLTYSGTPAPMTTTEFWNRFASRKEDRERYIQVLRDTYEEHRVEEFGDQGYCSYTLLITPPDDLDLRNDDENREKKTVLQERGDAFLVQLRPAPHALNLDIVRAASKTYPSLAPTIRPLDLCFSGRLHAYEMKRLHGTPFSRLQPRERTLSTATRAKLECLILSFADLIAQTWHSASTTSRHIRADSPMESTSDMLSQCPGKVGSSIIHRLQKLAAGLPYGWLRERAETTLHAVHCMSDYPVVLNHGDLIPSNILIDEETWKITGLVDWAEAEYLPFGTCLYGLEHLLGYSAFEAEEEGLTFVYLDVAVRLRELFWMRLWRVAPGLEDREKDVRVMRDVGVLLWHGIAWDDGAIDRVVNEVDDVEELARLCAFLTVS
ncbi:hypothetical protein BDW02DRAFT_595544 [Decorospora gaudefroyi]|uniref:Aminoglycoside phosphotransferase domain-containing protein n=1 Tax=Decorospora gaudefroyi TaxID=184978 RepID=A0A6A5KNU2_9PLEO|nr:hypothetical protein BDW02DRAFT_595544 [Decorospora gaudefroyi]